MRKEAAIIFGTGFQANYATLSALTEKGDVMICDHNLHASLVEGALRSPARTMRFRHNDHGAFRAVPEQLSARREDPDGLRRRVQHGRRSWPTCAGCEPFQIQAARDLRGRSARVGSAGPDRRGRGGTPGRAGRRGHRDGHVQQVAGVDGRVCRGPSARWWTT